MNIQPSLRNLERLTKSHIDSTKSLLTDLNGMCNISVHIMNELSPLCWLKLVGFMCYLQRKTREHTLMSLTYSLSSEEPQSAFPSNLEDYVHNFSTVTLTKTQLESLSHGIRLCIPSNKVDIIEVETQFEHLYSQLNDLIPHSEDVCSWFKSKLVDLAYQYRTAPTSQRGLLTREHLDSLRVLRSNKDLVILSPDKGFGTVLMDRKDYVTKMNTILDDGTKFVLDASKKDNSANIEAKVWKLLKSLSSQNILEDSVCRSLKPKGTHCARLYGLPKLHKPGIPLRPILSMVNTPQHKLAKWLVDKIEPIRQHLSIFTLKDSFQLIQEIKDMNIAGKHLVSFDVQSLFTSVPLHETIELICKHSHLTNIPTDALRHLLELCTKDVQFLFNDQLYKQADGVAMGSPLGPIFADIFMSSLEKRALSDINDLHYYRRYVDDTIIICRDADHVSRIQSRLNSLHPNIEFTIENEKDNALAFLDVLVCREADGSITRRVYHKPGGAEYMHFKSFVPISYKRTLVRTLFTRASKICSTNSFEAESQHLQRCLERSGYPVAFIRKYSTPSISNPSVATAPKKNVYIKLTYKGDDALNRLSRRLDSALQRTFPAAKLICLSKTTKIPIRPVKDSVPTLTTSNCIYKYECACGSTYVGRTERQLSVRAAEHLPRWLFTANRKQPKSSITKHLLDTNCTATLNAFQVISRQSKPNVLRWAEAVAIRRLKPDLCVQKEMVLTLALPW
jgi:hypothetical protein